MKKQEKTKPLDFANDTWDALSAEEAARFLKISQQKIYRLIKAGKIKTVNVGTGNVRQHYRIEKEAIESFIHGQR